MPMSPRTNPGHGSGPARYPGTFLLAFREAVAGLGWQIKGWHGNAVDCLDGQGEEHVVGLENLYRRARRAGRPEWVALIADFLQHALGTNQADDLPTDLAPVADQLLVRLGSQDRKSTRLNSSH